VVSFNLGHSVDSAADKLTYCALFDKSTNFGTEID